VLFWAANILIIDRYPSKDPVLITFLEVLPPIFLFYLILHWREVSIGKSKSGCDIDVSRVASTEEMVTKS